VQAKLQALDAEFRSELANAESGGDMQSVPLENVTVRAKKSAVAVRSVRLAWAPYWQSQDGTRQPAWQWKALPARSSGPAIVVKRWGRCDQPGWP
jgi:hypothetical protein